MYYRNLGISLQKGFPFSTATPLNIKQIFQKQLNLRKQKLIDLRNKKGNCIIAQVRIDDTCLGMKGLPVIFYDGSLLDPKNGITFRGHPIPQFCELSQKAPLGEQPLPQVMFFLLLTGRYPTNQQCVSLTNQWRIRGDLNKKQQQFILSLPESMHSMTMFSLSVLYLQNKSKFMKGYRQGMRKQQYWQYYYEDAMDLIAKLPHICATIYRRKYKDSKLIQPNHQLDWAGNFGHLLGFQDQLMKECLRGYLSVHADHEGGQVSSHTCHLVSSALSDPYLSFAAAINGLAGPLHGLANQQCLKWLKELKEYHKNQKPNKQKIQQFVHQTLNRGRVIPGYGHAALRTIDPRFLHFVKFANKHIKGDYICDLALQCFKVIPPILSALGKVKNPNPNIDAFSGALLQHYGLVQYDFYTVIFGMSRAIGCMANGIWARGFELPIERPNSINVRFVEQFK